jgi:ribosomal protein S27E
MIENKEEKYINKNYPQGATLNIICPNCKQRVQIVNIMFEENWRCIKCFKLFDRSDILNQAKILGL